MFKARDRVIEVIADEDSEGISAVHFKILPQPQPDKKKYELLSPIMYFSERYDKLVYMDIGYRSDGATGALDLASMGWWVHDKLCEDRAWADGSRCTAWQASMVLYDIMKQEGYKVRAPVWAFFSFLWQKLSGWK